jgi:hypothetical protein
MTTDDRHSTCTMSDDDTLDPTDQQHRMAKVLATCMRAALHTARVESSAHNVVLDMAGDIDPGGEVAWQALAANMLAPMRSLT